MDDKEHNEMHDEAAEAEGNPLYIELKDGSFIRTDKATVEQIRYDLNKLSSGKRKRALLRYLRAAGPP